ncbi:FecCD family ABC transporter permease [Shimia biformata]|uniref:FecCD family ABC transporter permease n=1 Tax=Shimia biformata TaxID=1294299 RepID=UPI001951B60A|nr:iron ABC transporter permease [Shimia biformata]
MVSTNVTFAAAAHEPGDRSRAARRVRLVLIAFLVLAGSLSLTTGASGVSLPQVLVDIVAGRGMDARDRIILTEIRLPRLLMGGLVGAALAMSGALMQGLFRNPLADPGIVGVSAGAGLGAVGAIVLGGVVSPRLAAIAGPHLVSVSAFVFAWISVFALYGIATRAGRTSVATMLLAGIALAALSSALTGLLVFAADDAQLRDFTFWSMGSLSGATWAKLWAAGPLMVAALVVGPSVAKGLNALALGEAAALHLGIHVQRIKTATFLTVACACGAAVAVSGGIGFVGIVVPHLLRLITGPDHRFLLVNSAILGAALLILADVLCRVVIAPAELPIGIITAVLGGPFFLWILLRQRSVVDI